MVKKFLLAVLFLTAAGLCAQDGTSSPYSYFGIGENRALGTVENQMMGGIGVYTDSIHVNLQNPASYGLLGLKSVDNGRLSVYSGALSRTDVRLDGFTDSQRSSVTNLEYIALAFNLTKGFGIGFGITPLSSVGYNFLRQSTNLSGATVDEVFIGSGGLSRVYFSTGYEVVRNLSVGVTANFNFGTIGNDNVQRIAGLQVGTLDSRESRIDGFDFNYAIQYNPKIGQKYSLYTSARVNTQINLVSRNTRRISSILTSVNETFENFDPDIDIVPVEVSDVDLASVGLQNTDIKIPTRTTLGLGFGVDKKWFLGADYSFQNFEDFTNDFLNNDNVVYQNASNLAIGGFFVPDYEAFNGYFNRVTYRAGMHMGNSGMIVSEKEIKDFGITFGLGLPLGRGFPNINVGVELGRRGTSTADLIEENYAKFSLGFSFNGLWFQKRKIN